MMQPSLELALLTTAPDSINGLQVFFTTQELATDLLKDTKLTLWTYQLSLLYHTLETLAPPQCPSCPEPICACRL